jgi:hypothetical protein
MHLARIASRDTDGSGHLDLQEIPPRAHTVLPEGLSVCA